MKEREFDFIHIEQVNIIWEHLRFVVFKHSLVQILAEHRRHKSNLFHAIEDAMPGFAFKLNRSVLILWPN